jgi:hypothetical protein
MAILFLSRMATRGVAAVARVRARATRSLCTSAEAAKPAAPPPPPPPPPLPEPGMIGNIIQQIQGELSGANANPAKLYGFVGACCNWFLGLSAVYDAASKGPEVISLKMTCVMLCYSTLFARWAGWAVSPRNYILAGSHMFNVVAQCNQLRRCLEYKLATGGEEAKAEVSGLVTTGAVAPLSLSPCSLTLLSHPPRDPTHNDVAGK